MAEFVEVMKKKDEVCKHYGLLCADCPLSQDNNSYGLICNVFVHYHPQEAEKIIMEWQKPVDWNKVKVDTPILVKQRKNDEWKKRHFAKLGEDGEVLAWLNGQTSYTANKYDTAAWKYAKLANDGDKSSKQIEKEIRTGAIDECKEVFNKVTKEYRDEFKFGVTFNDMCNSINKKIEQLKEQTNG